MRDLGIDVSSVWESHVARADENAVVDEVVDPREARVMIATSLEALAVCLCGSLCYSYHRATRGTM